MVYNLCYMTDTKKAEAIISIEKLRLIESELFRLSSKYGVKTVDELDKLIEKGKLSEEVLGEDVFLFDHLTSEKEKLEKELRKLNIKKTEIWKSLQHFLGLPKLSSRT